MVTGPSFTSETSILAPKTPVCTGTPSARNASPNRSHSGWASSGRAASVKLGPTPLPRVRDERELADDERLAGDIDERAVEAAGVVLEDPERRDLRSEPIRLLRSASPEATPTSTSTPGPIEETTFPSTATEASRTRWTTARTPIRARRPLRTSAAAASVRS